jgi:hypothetical protein
MPACQLLAECCLLLTCESSWSIFRRCDNGIQVQIFEKVLLCLAQARSATPTANAFANHAAVRGLSQVCWAVVRRRELLVSVLQQDIEGCMWDKAGGDATAWAM